MSLRSLRALCLTSFFIADVRDGLGPFLGIFLTQRHWQAEDIGLLMTVGGVTGLLATLPAGFITDTSRHKRVLLAGVCLAITLTTLLLWFSQKTSVVALSQVASGICAAFVGPLIAGITLGLTRQRGFSAQMGKNEAFNHAGNFFTALIAGWRTLDPRIAQGAWFNVGGKVYGTPYQWGPNLLMYNTRVFPTPPDSWSVVFVKQDLPDGKTNQGRVQAYDGPIYIADAALFVKATQPQLGIDDPYQLTETQYNAVLKVLRDQQPLIHRYWHDATVQMNDFKNEGVAASSSWPYQANGLKAEGQPVATVFPKEGVTGWADTTMLHSEAKHPVCAYKWMNWSLTPKVQGDVAAWFGSLPVVPEGCKASALLGEKGCETNGYDQFTRIHFWKTPIAEGGKYVPYSRWTQDYIAIMGGR